MALFDVKVPQLSESIAEALCCNGEKPGDMVAVDEILIEIETDKVARSAPPSAGVLAESFRPMGHRCLEQLIAALIPKALAAAAAAAAAAAPAGRSRPWLPRPKGSSMAGVATPAAAKLMADNQLAAGSVAGTGKDGRVTMWVMCCLPVAAQLPSPHLHQLRRATASCGRCPGCFG